MKHNFNKPHEPNRRHFLKTSGAALGLAGLGTLGSTSEASAKGVSTKPLISKGDVILFQGDSITDAGRNRGVGETPNHQPALGNGYAWLAAAQLLVGRPQDGLKIFNRGIGGHKVFQLADRWEADCLDLKPDVLSILIGVNDLWHTLEPKIGYNGTVGIYESDYHALVERTLKALPKVNLVICEPFVLRCGAVTDRWFPEFDRYRAAAKRVAEKHRATFVPFQSLFDEAINYAPPESALMASFWLRTVDGKR
mgnify:FL=1